MTDEEGVCPLWATFLTRDFYTRLAPIEGAPQALAGRAMSVSGTPESGLAREVASEKKIINFER